MNGVDVSGLKIGDVLELADDRAHMMVELEWAEYVGPQGSPDSLDRQHSRRIRAN